MSAVFVLVVLLALFLVLVVAKTAVVVPQQSAFVVERLGRFSGVLEAGFHVLMPFMDVVHDRYTLEVLRGCTRGCRFCQAGYQYRPRRQRPPEEVANHVFSGLANTGYDDVTLLSLSSTDYEHINELLARLNPRLSEQRVGLGLPSLRPETLTSSILSAISSARKSGLTIAPEAGCPAGMPGNRRRGHSFYAENDPEPDSEDRCQGVACQQIARACRVPSRHLLQRLLLGGEVGFQQKRFPDIHIHSAVSPPEQLAAPDHLCRPLFLLRCTAEFLEVGLLFNHPVITDIDGDGGKIFDGPFLIGLYDYGKESVFGHDHLPRPASPAFDEEFQALPRKG